jgi:uncharacterized membrane protein YbhN (UPF0104 family)
MDIWFWLALAFITVIAVFHVRQMMKNDGWPSLAGALRTTMLPWLLLAGGLGLALLLVLVTGGNDGLLLILGVPLAVGFLALIAWGYRD